MVMEINNFQGELTNVLPKTKTLMQIIMQGGAVLRLLLAFSDSASDLTALALPESLHVAA